MSLMKATSENSLEEEMGSSDYDAFSDVSVDSDVSESEIRAPGNLAWADAMSRVLNTNVSNEKNFILSKAKKDTVIKEKKKEEIEMVDESGHVIQSTESPTHSKTESLKAKRKKKLEKYKEKAFWESMCRVKPDITQREKERELIRIATRGVVHLFNTVEKHQKTKKSPKEKSRLRQEKLGKVKGDFMDILKGQSKNDLSSQADPAMKKAKQEETWNILKDDFMMGAEMKDWDKESDND